MTVQVLYTNNLNVKSSTNYVLFSNKNFEVNNLNRFFSREQISFIKEIVKKNLSDSDQFFDSLIESFKENLKEKKLNLVILDLDEEAV